MGIFQRISDIVSANFNDLVEQYEDPEKMLRQAIREMETAINTARPDVAKAMASAKTTAKELAANETQSESWAERARTAVEGGDDDLARKAISRKKEYEKIAAALRDQHEASQQASETLRRQFEGMQAKLKEAERKLGTLVARQKAANVRSKIAQSESASGSELDKNAFNKFDRLSRKVERAEAEAEAMVELTRSERADSLADDLSESSSEDLDIEAELIELKAKANRSDR
jgi:phage shock protein A